MLYNNFAPEVLHIFFPFNLYMFIYIYIYTSTQNVMWKTGANIYLARLNGRIFPEIAKKTSTEICSLQLAVLNTNFGGVEFFCLLVFHFVLKVMLSEENLLCRT